MISQHYFAELANTQRRLKNIIAYAIKQAVWIERHIFCQPFSFSAVDRVSWRGLCCLGLGWNIVRFIFHFNCCRFMLPFCRLKRIKNHLYLRSNEERKKRKKEREKKREKKGIFLMYAKKKRERENDLLCETGQHLLSSWRPVLVTHLSDSVRTINIVT